MLFRYSQPENGTMMKNTKTCLIFFFFLSLASLNALAELGVYVIDNTMNAPFPGEPTFRGDVESGGAKMRVYSYRDFTNGILYTANYSLSRVTYKEAEIPQYLDAFVKGGVLAVNGRLVQKKQLKIGSDRGVYYTIDAEVEGIAGRKCSAAIFRNGQFFIWTVQDLPGVSRLDARTIFENHVKYFSLN